jgi:hypothetical protein
VSSSSRQFLPSHFNTPLPSDKLAKTSKQKMRMRSLRPDCVAAPSPHVNTTRLPLGELQSYLQNLLTGEKHTKYCEYLLRRSISYISEFNSQSTELLSPENNLFRRIGGIFSRSRAPLPALVVEHKLLNPKFDQILQRIYQFYQRIMIKTWPQRQNLDNEVNENHALLFLFELDQQLIFTIIESDQTINEFKLQLHQEKEEKWHGGGCRSHLQPIFILKMVIFATIIWCCCCPAEARDR